MNEIWKQLYNAAKQKLNPNLAICGKRRRGSGCADRKGKHLHRRVH